MMLVIILVIDAGGVFKFEFFSNRISLVSKSITIACSALVSIALTLTGKENNDKDNRKSSDSLKQMTGRVLGLVASCYARAGSAVTAEGLL